MAEGLDVRCNFVGSPPEGDSATVGSLKALAIAEGVADRIRFVFGRTDVREPLGEADIFVLPSRFEGFGLVLLEAMAAGLPVIASDVDGPAELLVDGSNGIKFAVGSERDLARKIMALAARPISPRGSRRSGASSSPNSTLPICAISTLASMRR